MNLTDEQLQIIHHDGDARISAVAGSGKTSTLIEYAKMRPQNRMLYIAYNRSVKEEAIEKFARAGCRNVAVQTAHSLAWKGLDVRNRFQVAQSGGNLRVTDIIDYCNIKPHPNSNNAHLLLSRHIQRALNLYCNSAARSVEEIDYLDIVSDKKSRDFVSLNYDLIMDMVQSLMTDMYNAKIPVTHDAYLKFYQLKNPTLKRYDTLLFDEGQDASPVMLDIFQKQRGNKIIVGDRDQQIYGFRHAVNSLDRVNFKQFSLSTSFRFRQEVADLAMAAIGLKGMIGQWNPVTIKGAGNSTSTSSYAVLARGNLGLLQSAIEGMLYHSRTKIYFEGNLESYTYLSDGASLFDVLYLRLGFRNKIRGKFIRQFHSYDDLVEYIEVAEDMELRLIADIVSEYGPNLIEIMTRLRALQVPKHEAEIIYSTCHKAKGQEYDVVELMSDFINGEKLNSILEKARKDKNFAAKLDTNILAEEINILYVALTRVRNTLLMEFDVLEGFDGESDYYVYNGTQATNNGPAPVVIAY